MIVTIDKRSTSLVVRQHQMYVDMEEELDDKDVNTIGLRQEEPLCDEHYNNGRCDNCPVSNYLGAMCGKRGFYMLHNYVDNKSLLAVVSHGVEVFDAIINKTTIPDETHYISKHIDSDKNSYWGYNVK